MLTFQPLKTKALIIQGNIRRHSMQTSKTGLMMYFQIQADFV